MITTISACSLDSKQPLQHKCNFQVQLVLLETSRCWCKLLLSNYHHKFIKQYSWIFFLSWPEPDNGEGDCTVRHATAKTNVQGSKRGECRIPHQSLNSSLLPADTLYLLFCYWEKLFCRQREKGRDNVGLPQQSLDSGHKAPSSLSQGVCYHNIICDVGERTSNFLIVPQSTPHATTAQGFIRHWLLQRCEMASCWWLKLLQKTF